MATGGGSNATEAEDTVNKLICAICLLKYRRPKELPCSHTFFQSSQGLAAFPPSFHCPWCHSLMLMPPAGVGELQEPIQQMAVSRLQKKKPREFIYSIDPESAVIKICSISENRLWVMYTPYDGSCCYLKLFNAEGKVLTTVENADLCNGLLTIAGNLLLSWRCWVNTVQLITPDGSQSTHDLGMEMSYFVSCATKKSHYMKVLIDGKLCRVKFAFANDDQLGTSHPKYQSTRHLKNRLTHSVTEVVFDETPDGWSRHVSVGGRYFAFSHIQKLQVYTKAGSRISRLVSSYTAESNIFDACFCQIDGQEMLVVIVEYDDKIHVVDHRDGGHFVCYLDTGPLTLHQPNRLATDFDQHVWIGCDGGKVVVVDL